MKPFFLFVLTGFLSLVGCASRPLAPLPASHPASDQASESVSRPVFTDLREDRAIRKTHELLQGREQSQPTATPAMPMEKHMSM